jgi:hypothetical protein
MEGKVLMLLKQLGKRINAEANLCLHHIFTQILTSKEQTDSMLNYRGKGMNCLFGSGIYNHFMGFINCNGVVIFSRYRNSKTCIWKGVKHITENTQKIT